MAMFQRFDKFFMAAAIPAFFVLGMIFGAAGQVPPCNKPGHVYVVDTHVCVPLNAVVPAR
jgi:hypothetical protein